MRNPFKQDPKADQSTTSQPKARDVKPSMFAPKVTADDKQLKIVTHAAKEEEFLADGSPSKRTKKAEKHSKLEKENEAQHFSEASDVENITAIKKLFKLSVNIDSLKEVLEEMRMQIDANTT